MFGGFFKSKKKVEQGKAAERRDSFYEDEGDDGIVDDDENDIDDKEYGRRVTEEIAKRKSVNVTKHSAPVPVRPPSTAASSKVPPKAPTPPPTAQPAQQAPKATPPVSTTPKATAAPTHAAPAHASPAHAAPVVANHAKPTAAPVAQASKPVTPVATPQAKVATPTPVAAAPPVKAATTPVAAAAPPVKTATTPVAAAPASKPVVTVPITAPSPPVTPSSASSASRPNSATSAPQPMFVNASAVSAARPNSATTAPIIPKANSAAAARPFSATSAPVIVPIDKNAPPLDPKAIQQLVLMGFSYPASVMALQRCNNKSDLAAEFLLEHSEAEVNQMLISKTTISPKPVLPLTPTNAPITVTPKAVTPQPSPAVAAKAVEAPKPATPAHTPVTTTPVAAGTPAASAAKTSTTPKAAATTPPPSTSPVPQAASPAPTPAPVPAVVPSKPDVPVLRQASLKRAKPKEMEAVDTAMAAILAKREALKKQQAPPPSASAASSCLSSPRGGYMTDTSSTQGGSVFDKLSTYKTKGAALHEQQEEEDRQRREAQERRRKALAAPISGPAAAGATAADTDKETFQALFNKKTKSMVLNEKQEEEERVAREAHERKWKTLTTPRDSANVTSESDSEVFGKLYTTKLKSHKISEQVEQEEKAHLEKLEAHSSGRLGASVAPVTPTLVLKKTQSAMLREHFTLEDKQRLDEERAAEERMRKELESPGRRNKRSASADRSLHASSNEDFASSLDRSIQLARRRSNGDTIDTLDATAVDDIDTEDEDVDEKSKTKTATNGHTVRPSGPGDALSRQSSVRAADVQKQSSFYNKPDSLGKAKSFRANVSNVDKNSLGVPGVVTRERLPQEIQETADHNWVCKVVNAPRDGVSVNGRKAEIMVSVKGVYPSRQHCKAVAVANAPPRWATKAKNSLCGICEEAFNKYLKPENCSNCGQLVCADCSDENWPLNMVPESFCDKKTTPRVCAACNVLMEKTVAALKAGDLELVQLLHQTGNVNFHNQYSIFADAPYAIHCAAASGNLQLMKWLVEELYCPARDVLTGEALLNASGHSALMIAARRGDLAMMRYVVHTLGGNVTEIDEVSVLQRALHVALEAPGTPPVVVATRKLNTAQSFRRVDKANSNTSLEDSVSNGTSINTDSLLLKAADLAMRLRAPASARADAPTTLSSPAKSDTFSLPPSPSKSSAVAPPLSPTAVNVTAADSPQVSPVPSVPTLSATVITVSSPTKSTAAAAPVSATPSAATPVVASPPVALKATPSSADAAALRRAASEARIAAKTAPPAPLQRKPSGNLAARPPMNRTPSSITPASKKTAEATPTSTTAKASKETKEEKVAVAAVPTPVADMVPPAAVPAASTAVEEVLVPEVLNGVSEALSMEAAPAEVPEEVPVVEKTEKESIPEVVDVSAAQQAQEIVAADEVPAVTVDVAAAVVESPAVEDPLPVEGIATESPAPEATTPPVESAAPVVATEGATCESTGSTSEMTDEVPAAEVPAPKPETPDAPAVEPEEPVTAVEETSTVATVVAESPPQADLVPEAVPEAPGLPTAEAAVEQAAAEQSASAESAVPTTEEAIETATSTEVPTLASEPSSPSSPNVLPSTESPKESPGSKGKKSKKKGGAKASIDTTAGDVTDTSGSATPASPQQQVARSPSQRSLPAVASGAGAEFTKSSKRMNSMKVEAASENPTVRLSNLHRTNSSRSQSADGNSPSQPSNNN